MRLIFFLALLLMTSCTKKDKDPSQDACSILGLETKIFGGTSCGNGLSPVVKLFVGLKVGAETKIATCTGTVIARRKVLTAAHCFYPDARNPSKRPDAVSVSINAGNNISATPLAVAARYNVSSSYERDESAVLSRAQEIALEQLVREGFRGIPDQNDPKFVELLVEAITKATLEIGVADLAVVTFDRDLPFPSMDVLVDQEPGERDVVSIYGYGITAPGRPTTTDLVSGQVKIEETGRLNFTATADGSGSEPCPGDSGGPVVTKDEDDRVVVIGVISRRFGGQCNKPGLASAYTDLSSDAVTGFLRAAAPEAIYR